MDERLIINGKKMDLFPSSSIALTLQVNDIASIDNRQANFSRTIELPKSPTNIMNFEFLNVVGNNSAVPYSRNAADYIVGNEVLIHNGWAKIDEATTTYKCNLYSGLIDFYKSIENRTFSDLDLSSLDHEKTLTNVFHSWTGDTNYRYILADYGGKVTYSADSTPNIINTDYLVPSVSVSWLFDKIFERYSYSYTGSIFEGEDFKSLWMTFPKGTVSAVESEVFNSGMNAPKDSITNGGITLSPDSKSRYVKLVDADTTSATTISVNERHIQFAEAGTYRIKLNGKARLKHAMAYFNANLNLAKNKQSVTWSKDITEFETIGIVGSFSNNLIPFSYNFLTTVDAGETICLFLRANGNISNADLVESSCNISKVENSEINFSNELADFPVKDFINEIIWRYGLTLFPDNDNRTIDFLTLQERLSTLNVLDWTNKFNGLKSEKYSFGNYAQANYLRYKYNESGQDHHDGILEVSNVNLEDSRSIIQSKLFAPEKKLGAGLPRLSNIYPLWKKEPSEQDGEQIINYKSLDKHFYFLRSEDLEFATRVIGSEQLIESQEISSAPMESFEGLSFKSVSSQYYGEMKRILNTTKLLTARFHFSPRDIAKWDFKSLVYIAQLGSYFLVNKISNYVPNTITDVELIKVDYAPIESLQPIILGERTLSFYYNNDQLFNFPFEYSGADYMFVNFLYENWSDPNGLLPNKIKITQVPSIGALYHDGILVNNGDEFHISQQSVFHYQDDLTEPSTYATTIGFQVSNTDGIFSSTASVIIDRIAPSTLIAVNNYYEGLVYGYTHELSPLSNDVLGEAYLIDYHADGTREYGEPTGIIVSVDTSGFILGDVTIIEDGTKLSFVPNEELATSSFTYTIEDYTGRQSTATITINNGALED